MGDDEEEKKLHVAMLPWLALGHLLPFMELSKRLADKGHLVSFLTTPANLRRLPPSPPHLAALIRPVELPLPSVEHLPGGAEVTIDLPSDDLRPHLKRAYDQLRPLVASFLTESRPDWLVVDYASYWAPSDASALGVPCAHLSLFSAAVSAVIGPPEALADDTRSSPEDYTVAPEWVPFPTTIAYRGFEARAVCSARAPDKSGVTELYRFKKTIEDCSFVAVRSCDEFEPEWLRLLAELYRKPVVPVGFFPPLLSHQPSEEDDEGGGHWASIREWLDEQAPRSVVYAAFGSETKLAPEQVREIARGLELCGLPFLWAARSPESWLPEGFRRRTEGRGRVFFGWAPQVRVLAHPAMAGFLTHGGWNSIVEGLRHGLPMVVLPIMFDQGLNARNLVEKKVGVEVERDDSGDGSFAGEAVAEAVRLAVVEEEGECLREEARRLCRSVFGDEELQDEYVRKFIEHLVGNQSTVG